MRAAFRLDRNFKTTNLRVTTTTLGIQMEPKEPVNENKTTEDHGAPQLGEVVDAPLEYLEDQSILTWMKEQAMQEKVIKKRITTTTTAIEDGVECRRSRSNYFKKGIIEEKWCQCCCASSM